MRRWRLGVLAPLAGSLVTVLGLGALAPTSAGAGTPSAVPGTTPTQVQAGPQIVAGVADEGAVNGASLITGAVALRPRDPGALTSFISAVTTASSPQFHQYLPAGAFAARFGPTETSTSAVRAVLQHDGLMVGSVSSDGLMLPFSGTATQVESAFRTGLHTFRLTDGTSGTETTSAVDVPASIASSVQAVVGLNNLVTARPMGLLHAPSALAGSRPAAQTAPTDSSSGPQPCAAATSAANSLGGLTDDQIAHAYGADGLYNAGDVGAGQSIGVFELEPFLMSDLSTFDTCYYGATQAAQMLKRVNVVPIDGGQTTGPGSGEAILDVDDISGIAPGATIDVYEGPDNTNLGNLDTYAAMVEQDKDQVMTSSWGWCEQTQQELDPGFQQVENLLFEQAAAQGQSMLNATGDNGSDGCEDGFPTTPSPGQDPISVGDPASQPYVLAVGGTTIDDATQPPTETTWNDGTTWGSGNGGISESWTMPAWQAEATVPGIVRPGGADYTAANSVQSEYGYPSGFCDSEVAGTTPHTPCRLTPDVSADADEFTGAVTSYSKQLYGGWSTTGGTSSASPIWAGLLALVNDSPTCAANPVTAEGVGFVLPLLYAVASNPTTYAESFTDITVGNNDVFGLDDGKVFPTTAGFDLATGLGSPELTGPGGSVGLATDLCRLAAAPRRPVVDSVSPSSLGSSGGSVTIDGSGFSKGSVTVTGISVGAGKATEITVDSPTRLTATFPPAANALPPQSPQDTAGAASVVVILSDGASSPPTAASTIEYVAQSSGSTLPDISGLSPTGGSEVSPAPVTIFGSGFTGASAVRFGGTAASSFTVLSDSEIRVTPPAFGSETCAPSLTGQSPTTDVCQVEVQVQTSSGSSALAQILPPYEGTTLPTSGGGEIEVPPNCGCEIAPALTEYDYSPAPTITSISTSSGPAAYADELGGSTLTLTGTGFDPLTISWVNTGPASKADSQSFDVLYESGTEIQVGAPALVAEGGTPSVGPMNLPVSVVNIAGTSNVADATYAGVPTVSGVLTSPGGQDGAPDTGGTPIAITGHGFDQATGPVLFVGGPSPFPGQPPSSYGAQYTYSVNSNSSITTQTVEQEPATVDVQVCSVTGCSLNPPEDQFVIYAPGNPLVKSVTPSSGPAAGGTAVTIDGTNLGCVTSVTFGTVKATTFANAPGILACGSTDQVDATAPPGVAGRTVTVRVTTEESDFTGSGPSKSTATFTYEAG